MAKWISRISRLGSDGKPWYPSKNDRVCSAHFLESDYYLGLDHKKLREDAVPSVFPQHPPHKQIAATPRRPSPRKRKIDPAPSPSTSAVPAKAICFEHNYSYTSLESHLAITQKQLAQSKEREQKLANELRKVKATLEDPSMSDVALIFDAMAIRKQVVYDQKLQKYVGFINYGNHNIAGTSDRLATESLTFLIVGQKKFFKHPIGYFLIDKVDAKQQAEMVKEALCVLSDAGFNVVSIVCDGAFSNQATATHLGCSLTPDNIKTEINHPCQDQEVNMMFDACHLIKNVRNCLGELGTIFYGDEKIEWKFIAELHKFQLNSNLHLANKLRGTHLDFVKNKMKVALSQDHLETLFGRIRRRGGWNNNPNAPQFKHALRALLQKNGVLSSNRGNCVQPTENTLCATDDDNSLSFELGTDCHIMSEDDHPTQILKEACRRFCNMMLHHHGKLFNQRHVCGDSATVRHKLNKTVLFLHQ
ncbi:THAP domain-containing protein 9 [Elysia marginata]|uniref:THAP domain-containing protein 9 n=1 Tax=Elysia marginata TaxID=1093978 RepID=A0AAV4HG65_9GAST|nr:THAP domain-containing protein 9 [Elysia marginata]